MINMPPYFGTVYSREHQPVVFTSHPFPYVYDDALRLSNPNPISSTLRVNSYNTNDETSFSFAVNYAQITETIRYINWTWYNPDQVFFTNFSVQTASLNTVIAYKSIVMPPDQFSITNFAVQSASLNTAITYINYYEPIERLSIGFSIQTATLA